MIALDYLVEPTSTNWDGVAERNHPSMCVLTKVFWNEISLANLPILPNLPKLFA